MKIAAVLFASAVAFTTYSLHASTGDLPDGWALQGEAPQLYSASIDRADSPSGKGSVVLQRAETSHPYGSAWLLQPLAADYAGKCIRLSYHIRSQGAEVPDSGIVVRDSHGQHTMSLMKEDNWVWIKHVISLPKDTKAMSTGVSLKGPGTIKIDAVTVEVLGDAPADQPARRIRKSEDCTK